MDYHHNDYARTHILVAHITTHCPENGKSTDEHRGYDVRVETAATVAFIWNYKGPEQTTVIHPWNRVLEITEVLEEK